MYKITITKVKEAEEQTITRKYDDGCTDEVFQEAVIEMIDQLKDTSEIPSKKNPFEMPGFEWLQESLDKLTIIKDSRTMEDIINLKK